MKVFITGIAGFLGSHLADRLKAEGHEVSGCDNLIGGDIANVPEGVGFFASDCGDLEKMKQELAGVDVVYHCACTAHEGLSSFSPYFITQNTYGITMSVLTAAIYNNVKRFVYCSSMARYGSIPVPFKETDVPVPQDPYAIAKLAAEAEIANLCHTHGMEYVIAVPHNIIGPRQKYDDPYRNVASIMINRMLQGQQPFIYGNGEQKRSFSFVQDVVGVLAQLGTKEGISGEIFNVGPDASEEFTSVNELATKIADIIGFELKPIYVGDRPREVKEAACSSQKIKEVFGYETKTTLIEGLRQMVESIKTLGPKPFEYKLPVELENSPILPETWKNKSI